MLVVWPFLFLSRFEENKDEALLLFLKAVGAQMLYSIKKEEDKDPSPTIYSY